MRRLLAILALAVAVSRTRGAEETQRVLLLAETRPVLVGFQVRLDGKPLSAAWRNYLDRLFDDLDRDGDGTLSRAEAARAPSVGFLATFLQGGLPLESRTNRAGFESLDGNRDGKVSRQEFAAYYGGCGFDRVQVVAGPDRDQAAALTSVLFSLLDSNRDGQLSKEELLRSREVLHRIDLDEDEWITPEELLLHRPPKSEKSRSRATLESIGFLPLLREDLTPEQKGLVLGRYGKNARLEKMPEVELIARLGKVPGGEAPSDLLKPDSGKPLRTRDGALQVPVEGLALELSVEKSGGRVRGLHAFYRQQFEASDADRRGFLERKQTDDVPSLAALALLADRDADGRLTAKELDAFLDLHALGTDSFVTLTVTDQSLSLFDLLDEDSDGRLSLRELHTAWARLRRFDRDGDSLLARSEFPRRLQLRASRGTPVSRPASAAKVAADPPRQQGPAWFLKMDRNGDGFVSRREFLGPEAVFNQLDADGDGLISPEEASAK